MIDAPIGVSASAQPVGALPDGTVYYAPLGGIVHDGDERVLCHVCGRWMRRIGGTHLTAHGWTLDAYREAFQLLAHIPTCSRDLSVCYRRGAKRTLAENDPSAPRHRTWAGTSSRRSWWRSLAQARPDFGGGVPAGSQRRAASE